MALSMREDCGRERCNVDHEQHGLVGYLGNDA